MVDKSAGDGAAPGDRRGLHDLSEDATGFGATELRTAWGLVRRPHELLEDWMTQGPSGGGRWTRPLRFYLALNGVLMLILFLKGGTDQFIAAMPADMLQDLVARSGKSREGFLNDADNWTTLVLVPILSVFYALACAPFLRWWDAENLGWRRAFRASFAYLCAWTVLIMPLAWWGNEQNVLGALSALVMLAAAFVAFVRMGRGRWWRTRAGAMGKAFVLSISLYVVGTVGFLPVLAIGVLGGLFAP